MMQSPDDIPFIPFESFEVGQSRRFGAYKVTREEIIDFASKYDAQFFHLDDEMAKASLFGGLCASGWHTCAMTMAMMVEDLKSRGRSLGSPGIDELRWIKPVYPGDTLSVELTVQAVKPSKSRPQIGIVTSLVTVSNHKGEPVMRFVSNGIFPRSQPEETAS